MKSFFNQEDNQEILERIGKLDTTSKRLWGKMTISQMIVHCQISLDNVEKESKIKRSFLSLLLGKIVKRKLLKSKEMEKNLPTDKNYIVSDSPDFELEKNKLIKQIERFETMGEKVIRNNTHPFFGHLTNEEWGILCYKHLDHHLKQFGV